MGDAVSQQQQEAAAAVLAGSVCPSGATASAEAISQACAAARIPSPPAGDPATQGGAAVDSNKLCEPLLLSQLVQLLGHRARQSLLLSDLGALLPAQLRHGVKEKGGLRSWLQRYPELFRVTGQPGKESVTLLIGSAGAVDGVNGENVAAAPGVSLPVDTVNADGSTVVRDALCAAEADQKLREDEENESAVQLRGLPYRATVSDIKAFLGRHVEFLKGDSAVQVVLNRDGRPSGFARVQFSSQEAAREARDELHMCIMKTSNSTANAGTAGADALGTGDRYVEMFLFSERPNKLRFKKTAPGDGTGNADEEELANLGVTKEQVVTECREHMSSPGKGQLLLSMLGVALSQPARLYLKKTDQGLKHFLSHYSNEFTVDGLKGRECVSFLPALAKGGNNSDLPPGFPETKVAPHFTVGGTSPVAPPSGNRRSTEGGGATGSIGDLRKRWEEPALVPESPKVKIPDTPHQQHAMATPSDWGTPQLFPGVWNDRQSASALSGQPPSAPSGGLLDPCANPLVSPAGFYNGGWPSWTAGPQPNPMWGATSFWPQGAVSGSWNLTGNSAAAGQQTAPAQNEQAVVTGADGAASLQQQQQQTQAGQARQPPIQAQCGAPAPATISAATQVAPPQGAAEPMFAHTAVSGTHPAIRLRGLPLAATEQDVLAFFAKHDVVECIADQPKAVRLILKGTGKPSGQAVVQMQTRDDTKNAIQALSGQWISSRYIEVFADNGDIDDVIKDDAGGEVGNPLYKEAPCGQVGLASLGGILDVVGDTGGSGECSPGSAQPLMSQALLERFAQDDTPAGQTDGNSWEALFDIFKTAAPPRAGDALPPGPLGATPNAVMAASLNHALWQVQPQGTAAASQNIRV